MKVIILAAGYGSRLLPYTKETPKCMVKLAGKPLLQYQIETLNTVGLNDITVVGGHHIEKIIGKDIKVIKNNKYDCTNMVYSLFCAEKLMNEEDLIITYGDIIYEKKVLDSLTQSTSPIAISVDKDWYKLWKIRMANPLEDAETLKLRDGVYIDELGKKPKDLNDIQGQYMGLIKISADFAQKFRNTWHNLDRSLNYDGQNFENMYMTSFIQKFINDGIKVEAAFTNGGWLEIDTKSDLDMYHNLYKNDKLKEFIKL